MGLPLKKMDHSNMTEIATIAEIATDPGVGPQLAAYASGSPERRELGMLTDMLERCTPQAELIVANTAAELVKSAKEADYVLLFQDSAIAAVRRAVSLGVEISKALSEWRQHAEKTEKLLEQLDGSKVLVLSDGQITADLAHHLGIAFSGGGRSSEYRASTTDEPILDYMIESVVLRAPELRDLIVNLEANGLKNLSKMDSLEELADDAISDYFVVQSKLTELRAEQDSLRNQLVQAQRGLKLHLDAFHYATNRADGDTSHIHGAFYEALSQSGDRRRREPLRAALSHAQTVADIGPLAPRTISAPFLTKRLSLSAPLIAPGAPASAPTNSAEDFPVGGEVTLPPLLRRNAAVKMQGDKLEVRRGAPGHQFYGPYLKLPQGRYRLDATFDFLLGDRLARLTRRDGPMLEVICGGDQLLAVHHFSATVFSAGSQNVSLEFDLPSHRDSDSVPGLETRLWTKGDVGLIVENMTLRRLI